MLMRKKFKWLSPNNNVQDIVSIISDIVSKKKIEYFIEPFAGGLSTAVKVTPILAKNGVKHIIVNNVNQTVINTYHYTRNNVADLFAEYWSHEEELNTIFEELLDTNKDIILNKAKELYDSKKKEFNKNVYENSIKHSALFLFLVNRSLNLTYSVNSKEEYVAPFSNDIRIFKKTDREKTFKNYSDLFVNFEAIFERMDPFEFIDKYKNNHKNAIFYFDPDYSNTLFQLFDKNYNLIKAEQMSFTQFYKVFDNVIIKKEDNSLVTESLIDTNDFKLANNHYFKY